MVIVNVITSDIAKHIGKFALKCTGRIVMETGCGVASYFIKKKIVNKIEEKQKQMKEDIASGKFDLVKVAEA